MARVRSKNLTKKRQENPGVHSLPERWEILAPQGIEPSSLPNLLWNGRLMNSTNQRRSPSRESGNCLRHNAELPAVGPHCRRNLLMCSRGSPKPLYWTNLGSWYPSGNGLSYTSGGCMCTGLKPPISLWSRANSNIWSDSPSKRS